MTSFGIWCEVWGGVTGSRAGWMKSNGRIIRYRTREPAEIIARQQQAKPVRSTAQFRYTVREIPEEVDL